MASDFPSTPSTTPVTLTFLVFKGLTDPTKILAKLREHRIAYEEIVRQFEQYINYLDKQPHLPNQRRKQRFDAVLQKYQKDYEQLTLLRLRRQYEELHLRRQYEELRLRRQDEMRNGYQTHQPAGEKEWLVVYLLHKQSTNSPPYHQDVTASRASPETTHSYIYQLDEKELDSELEELIKSTGPLPTSDLSFLDELLFSSPSPPC
jgi:hypothetical protein